MQAFNVYRKGRVIDTVYFLHGIGASEVRESLINHDCYPNDIRVRMCK
jgi:hypothetical protein